MLRTVAPSFRVVRLAAMPSVAAMFDGLRDGAGAVAAQLGESKRGRERAVGAVRMDGEPALRRPPKPRARLVGQDQRLEQRCARQAARLGFGQRRRDDLDAGMRARAEVAFVEVVPGAGRAVHIRRILRSQARGASREL